LEEGKPSAISVISVSGVLIKTIQFSSLPKVVQLDVSSLSRGAYIVKLMCGSETLYRKFEKLKVGSVSNETSQGQLQTVKYPLIYKYQKNRKKKRRG